MFVVIRLAWHGTTHTLAGPFVAESPLPQHGAADTHTNATAATTVSTVLSTISTPLVHLWSTGRNSVEKLAEIQIISSGQLSLLLVRLTILISVQLKCPYHKRSCKYYNGLAIQLVALLVDSSDLDEYCIVYCLCTIAHPNVPFANWDGILSQPSIYNFSFSAKLHTMQLWLLSKLFSFPSIKCIKSSITIKIKCHRW